MFDGPEGRAYGRHVAQQTAELTEFAGRLVLDELPGLAELAIGSEGVNLTRDDHGQPDMSWPWTGRMEQYTYGIWGK